jgi:hypothetical protein
LYLSTGVQNVERIHLSHGSLGTADGEGWEAGTTVGAVVVAGGAGWEAGAIVAAGGEGWQAAATAAELRAAQACSDTSRCNPTNANGIVSIQISLISLFC